MMELPSGVCMNFQTDFDPINTLIAIGAAVFLVMFVPLLFSRRIQTRQRLERGPLQIPTGSSVELPWSFVRRMK